MANTTPAAESTEAYAIVEASGTQVWVQPNRYYDLDRLQAEVDDTITLDNVLLVAGSEHEPRPMAVEVARGGGGGGRRGRHHDPVPGRAPRNLRSRRARDGPGGGRRVRPLGRGHARLASA